MKKITIAFLLILSALLCVSCGKKAEAPARTDDVTLKLKPSDNEALEVLSMNGISAWQFEYEAPDGCLAEFSTELYSRGSMVPEKKPNLKSPCQIKGKIVISLLDPSCFGGSNDKIRLSIWVDGGGGSSMIDNPFLEGRSIKSGANSQPIKIGEEAILLLMTDNSAVVGPNLEEMVKIHDKTLVLKVRFEKQAQP
jgi:hypothetical protein